MELITIIIPVFNAENYLQRCLNSVVNQTYGNIEAIMIDDGSNDKSAEICQKFASEDNRFKYVYQENSGVSAARNSGIARAKGKYVCFIDSDDWISPHHIEGLYNAITKENADLAVCGGCTTDGENILETIVPDLQGVCDKKTAALQYCEGNKTIWNSPCNKIYKKERIKTVFKTDMSCGEDCDFNMKYLITAEKIAVTHNSSYFYYTPQSATVKYLKNDARQCYLYSESVREFLSSCLSEREYIKDFERFVCGNVCRDAGILAKSRRYKEAYKKIKEFYNYPLFRRVLNNKAWKGLGLKYAMVGWILKLRMVGLLIVLSKILK